MIKCGINIIENLITEEWILNKIPDKVEMFCVGQIFFFDCQMIIT